MATKESEPREASGITENPVTASTQVRVRWDDTNMRNVYSNVCNVAGTREEIVLLFGMNQAWHSGQKEVTVQLADRIVLSPFVAKRLAALLNNVIRDYESKFGSLEVEGRKG